VIEGEVVVSVVDEEAVLRAEDAVSFPGGAAHGDRNDGMAGARSSLTVFEPTANGARQ
jgi:uncharacterized cupin superfamily protein